MGYSIYQNGGRYAGYGVPAICEHPGCNEQIDRGCGHACGDEPFSELGCDRYFCGKHLRYHSFNIGGGRESRFVCERCAKRKQPFPYKPEHKDWVKHLLTDPSWEEWRKRNKDKVEELSKQ